MQINRSLMLVFGGAVAWLAAFSATPANARTKHAAASRKERATGPTESVPPKSMQSGGVVMRVPLVVPLFLQNRHFSSTLVLVNGTTLSTYADVVLRDLYGAEITNRRVPFAPHSQVRLEIAELLLKTGSRAYAGSLTVMQSPDLKGMSILAQMTMTYLGSAEPSYIDEEVSMPSPDGSQVLRAVSEASGPSPVIAVTSLSESNQSITIACQGASGINNTKSVQLLAGETLITEACTSRTEHGSDLETIVACDDDRSPPHRGEAIGISLSSDAMSGSYAAFGMTLHRFRDSQYFSGFTFDDPKMSMSSTTIFAGVPVDSAKLLPEGRYVPQIFLANFADKAAHATIKYSQMIGATASVRDVGHVTIPAGATKELALDVLAGDVDMRNSFIVSCDGAPGDVATKLVAKGDSRLREVELEAKDEMDSQNGGNHPWSIEQGTESTLLLFNHSQQHQRFTVMISGDGVLWNLNYAQIDLCGCVARFSCHGVCLVPE